MRLHGNQRLLHPGIVPDLHIATPESMARRKELDAELGTLTKQVEDEKERLKELAGKSDFSSQDWRNYRVGMLELGDKRERVRDLKVDLSLLPAPTVQAKPAEPNAFERWVKNGVAALSEEERREFTGAYEGMAPTAGAETFRFSDFIRAGIKDEQVFMAATRSDDDSGKEGVGVTIDPTVLQALKQYGGAVEYLRAIRTATGDTRRFLHMDDSSQMGEVLSAQAAALGSQDLSIDGVEMTAKTVTSKFVTVSVEFLADDESGMAGIIQDLCYRRIGRVMNQYVTVTQANYPNSIMDCIQGQTVNSGDAADLAKWKRLIQLIFKVNAAYRSAQGETGMWGLSSVDNGRIGFMMHSDAEAKVVQMTDDQNRPVVIPSPQAGIDFMIAGFPYKVNDQMDGVAANKYPMAFFNGNYYGIRYVGQMMFERFYDSATAANQTVKFLAKTRFDFGPLLYTAGDGRNAATRCPWGARLKIAA